MNKWSLASVLAAAAALVGPSALAEPFPHYTYSYPSALERPAYANEPLVSNGSISAFVMNQGTTSYYPSQLKKIMAPPYLLNNDQDATLFAWGFDDLGFHSVQSPHFTMDYSLDGIRLAVPQLTYQLGNETRQNPHWQVAIEYHAVPGKRVLLATYRYKNNDTLPHALRLAVGLRRPQIVKTIDWSWWNPQGGAVSAAYDGQLGTGAIVSASTSSEAHLVFGLDKAIDSYAVTDRNEFQQWLTSGRFSNANRLENSSDHLQFLAHDFGSVAAGASVDVTAVIALGGTEQEVRSDYLAVSGAVPAAMASLAAYWQDQWQQTRFAVKTPEPAMDQMSNLAMAMGLMSWDHLNNSWVTGFGDNARGIVYRWDTYYTGYGFQLSNPVMAKETLRNHLRANWRTNYAYRIYDHVSVGAYYAYNHVAITNLVYQYVTLTHDFGFLAEAVNGKTVLQILSDECNHVHSTLRYDFGENGNLLEVVPHYVHEVPDLVAATYWMAGKIKAMALQIDQPQIAAPMDAIAAESLRRTQALWQADARWFKTGRGDLVYTSKIFDMVSTGALTQAQIDGLLARKDDFIGPYGLRSLAKYDSEAKESTPRGDWDGPGSYVAVAGDMMTALSTARRRDDLHRMGQGLAQWWQWRPIQAQGIDAATGKIIGPIGLSTVSAGARYVEVVPFQLIGLRYRMGGIDVFDNVPSEWSNSAAAASYAGNSYSAMVQVPVKDSTYSVYIDKPNVGPSVVTSATIYTRDANGQPHGEEWESQRLPMREGSVAVVLHFGTVEPEATEFDELTEVLRADGKTLQLRNTKGSVEVTLAAGVTPQIQLQGVPNKSYQLYVGGNPTGQVTADAAGTVMVRSLQAAASQQAVRLVPQD